MFDLIEPARIINQRRYLIGSKSSERYHGRKYDGIKSAGN